ncbi:hypothetical protein [Pseudoalteromonas piratica]|uniref:Uncharacterized protein n=1 Tax=Pseudoalteromonas piratica TaxID=1348114 RepID=A0A0A7EEX1_9GAMM|nr:hypothetical protein [Pseudoalteromonas piratica]AIY65220.1 hypothetical protein OM33_08635 [Pseudoalteromonas piratica]
MIRLAFIGLLLSYSSSTFASAYNCKILDGKELDNSSAKLVDLKGFFSPMLGRSFVVERETGSIISKTFNNSRAREITVLDIGSEKNAFKSISLYGPNKKISYLVINEHLKSATKSFIFHHEFDVVYSGTCTEI